MKVILHPQDAAPVLRRMAPEPKKRLKTALAKLADDPMGHRDLDIRMLRSSRDEPAYRLRVGVWRAVYLVRQDVLVMRIFHRREGYGWLERL